MEPGSLGFEGWAGDSEININMKAICGDDPFSPDAVNSNTGEIYYTGNGLNYWENATTNDNAGCGRLASMSDSGGHNPY